MFIQKTALVEKEVKVMIEVLSSHLSVFVVLLVVEVGLETEFGSTDTTLEASSMEKSEILERTNFIYEMYSGSTAKATVFIGSRSQSLALRNKLRS